MVLLRIVSLTGLIAVFSGVLGALFRSAIANFSIPHGWDAWFSRDRFGKIYSELLFFNFQHD
ncbi:hypothetical protein [Anabaena sp. UHCC 0399]|uniref:hypothetical protein n=1 Tax=Anabaena sp. UHCC 0399 TaxID=3110238 RepID=UPI002B1F430B|nr:hypothetical protein [Anabaena sp. UHCC 0399]MEA5565865.1 hypothetical protein [Anabaena sp. UHCC 0399]